MPEITPTPEPKVLEQDLLKLVKEVQTHKERPENAGLNDQQLVKMAVQSLAAAAATTASAPAPVTPAPTSDGPLPAYMKDASAQTKHEVEYLVNTALHKGLDKANEEARKANSFVLDAFHDTLTGKLHDELQKRGLLK